MQNYPELAVTFLKNPVQIIIFETRRGRFEKVFFYHSKPNITKNKKLRNKTFQVNLTQIKHSLKGLIKKNWNSDVSFSFPLSLFYLHMWAPLMLTWFTYLSIVWVKLRKLLWSGYKYKNLWFCYLFFLWNKILSKSKSLLQFISLP